MTPRLNVVTLGVSGFARSVRFYQDLGFERRLKATGDEIAFFDAGGMIIALFRWDALADDAHLPSEPRPQGFRGVTLAQLCRTDKCVDAFMTRALGAGATLLKHAQKTPYGAIRAMLPIRTATPGKPCARRASNSPRTGA